MRSATRSCSLAAAVILAVASCAPPKPPPAEPPPPPPQPQPVRPTPAPALDWQSAPLAPGGWSWTGTAGTGRSSASFGEPGRSALVLRCEENRQVTLTRAGAAHGSTITIRTSTNLRTLPAAAGEGGAVATLSAHDPLLDAMVFSRGRFAVEAPGTPLLIVAAWPEPARVVEDCRG